MKWQGMSAESQKESNGNARNIKPNIRDYFSGLISRLDIAEQGINKFEDELIKIIYTETQKEKIVKKKIEPAYKTCGTI